jgi:hypothetical protein
VFKLVRKRPIKTRACSLIGGCVQHDTLHTHRRVARVVTMNEVQSHSTFAQPVMNNSSLRFSSALKECTTFQNALTGGSERVKPS